MNKDAVGELVQDVQRTEEGVRTYLDTVNARRRLWPFSVDPVRTKNLEKVAGHLQVLLDFLDSVEPACFTEHNAASLCTLLKQLENPSQLKFDSAWDLADMLEIALIHFGDDQYLYVLLNAEQQPPDSNEVQWLEFFKIEDLETLLKSYCNGSFRDGQSRLEVRRYLEFLRLAQIQEYRRDRAKVQLRGMLFDSMAIVLLLLLIGLSYFSIQAAQLGISAEPSIAVPLVLIAGGVGSVLSRLYKLGKQPLHSTGSAKTIEPPLGIRALMSDWKLFLAQPAIGATAALVVYWVFSSQVLTIGGNSKLDATQYALLGFLAGFSEPFFIGILDKVAGQAGTTLD